MFQAELRSLMYNEHPFCNEHLISLHQQSNFSSDLRHIIYYKERKHKKLLVGGVQKRAISINKMGVHIPMNQDIHMWNVLSKELNQFLYTFRTSGAEQICLQRCFNRSYILALSSIYISLKSKHRFYRAEIKTSHKLVCPTTPPPPPFQFGTHRPGKFVCKSGNLQVHVHRSALTFF